MAMLFGLESTMTAVNVDAAKGVTDRFRSLPISPAAVVLGRCIADMINSVAGLAVLVGAGLLLGWSWKNGLPAALAAFGLLLLLRFALLWVGIFIGLQASGPEAVGAVQILVWPISMLSNLFVDPATMPGWLGAIASWNPLSATASATRELFGNPGWNDGSWLAENAVLLAVALAGADHRGVRAAGGPLVPQTGRVTRSVHVTAGTGRSTSRPTVAVSTIAGSVRMQQAGSDERGEPVHGRQNRGRDLLHIAGNDLAPVLRQFDRSQRCGEGPVHCGAQFGRRLLPCLAANITASSEAFCTANRT